MDLFSTIAINEVWVLELPSMMAIFVNEKGYCNDMTCIETYLVCLNIMSYWVDDSCLETSNTPSQSLFCLELLKFCISLDMSEVSVYQDSP